MSYHTLKQRRAEGATLSAADLSAALADQERVVCAAALELARAASAVAAEARTTPFPVDDLLRQVVVAQAQLARELRRHSKITYWSKKTSLGVA